MLCFFFFRVFCVSFSSFFCSATTTYTTTTFTTTKRSNCKVFWGFHFISRYGTLFFFLFCVFCVSFSSFFVLLLPLLLLLLLLLLPLQCINGYIRVKLGYKPKRFKKFPHFFGQFSSSASFSSVYFVYLFLLFFCSATTTYTTTTFTTTKWSNCKFFLGLSLSFKVRNSVFSYVVKSFWYALILLRHTWVKTERKGSYQKYFTT